MFPNMFHGAYYFIESSATAMERIFTRRRGAFSRSPLRFVDRVLEIWESFGDLRPRARTLAIVKRNKRFPAPSEFQTSSGTIPFQISSGIPSLPHFLLRRFVISRSCSFIPAIKPFMETTSSRFEPVLARRSRRSSPPSLPPPPSDGVHNSKEALNLSSRGREDRDSRVPQSRGPARRNDYGRKIRRRRATRGALE